MKISKHDEFFDQQEQEVGFSKDADTDDWTNELSAPVVVKGIIKIGSPATVPTEDVATDFDQFLTIFLKPAVYATLPEPVPGDILTWKGSKYGITRVDGRGVLPSDYSCRLEAKR